METRNSNPIPYETVPPGEILGQELKARKIRQTDFAKQIGMQTSHLSALIHGARNFTPLLAQRVEDALGISAKFWLSLQADYDLRTMRPSNAVDGYAPVSHPLFAIAEPDAEYSALNPMYEKGVQDGCEETRKLIAHRLKDRGFDDSLIGAVISD